MRDLFTAEACQKDAGPRKDREILDTGKRYAELPTHLLNQGWETCARCFPRHSLTDPEAAIMDVGIGESG